ncbi:MAG TPA: GNAT family N-acetyltransferase [Blastocatellia bacterium]|nr:GNAT family N-acetyltransferase [Blastocatellia bacterium]
MRQPAFLSVFEEGALTLSRSPLDTSNSGATHKLTAGCEEEVLAFLGERPIHTIIMSGFIRDNGLESPLNRGAFYACRSAEGQLEGVALIGHSTLIEVRSETALAAFAHLARDNPDIRMIIGEQEKIGRFWNHYAEWKQVPHSRCRELLFEQRWPFPAPDVVRGLRLATPDDLTPVMTAHSRMAEEELGVNPLLTDPQGFRLRCARRIERGRVWVWIRHGRLIFKADVISDTPEVIYLEGLYVDPRERGRGYGGRCLAQVSRNLLARTQVLCLLVSEHNRAAQALYRKVGYIATSCYETIFLHPSA